MSGSRPGGVARYCAVVEFGIGQSREQLYEVEL